MGHMPKLPDYRLQTLFDMREKARKEAEDAYAEAMKAKLAEEKKLEEMKQELERMIQAREAKRLEYAERAAKGEYNVSQIQANHRHIDRMKEKEGAFKMEIEKQKDAIKRAEEVVEEKKQAMIEATQEFKALEKHKEKWAQEVKREMAIKEEDNLEDIAQTIFLRRMREAKEDEGG
ncbi:MAG: flagellar assembly protein FliH [Myxococcota bacterium]